MGRKLPTQRGPGARSKKGLCLFLEFLPRTSHQEWHFYACFTDEETEAHKHTLRSSPTAAELVRGGIWPVHSLHPTSTGRPRRGPLLMLGSGGRARPGVRARVLAWLITKELHSLCPMCHSWVFAFSRKCGSSTSPCPTCLGRSPCRSSEALFWMLGMLQARHFPPCSLLSFSVSYKTPHYGHLARPRAYLSLGFVI